MASETGIAELEVQRGDNRVRIRRASFAAPQEIVLSPPPYASPGLSGLATAPHSATDAPKEKGEIPKDPNVVLVKSPIVGTLLRMPVSRCAAVRGARGRTRAALKASALHVIESMKLMNEIESETSGIIESKLVVNGQPVEYGEALFAVRTV